MEISAPLGRSCSSLETVEIRENVNPVYQPRWELAKILLRKDMEVIKALEKVVQITDYDTISVALVMLFRMYNKAHGLLKYFIGKEIQETTEAATLFRGISLATKMVSAFCMQEGQAYCKNILDPSLKMFCIDEVSIEVDPNKLNSGEDLEINQAKLLGVCKGLLNHITRSVEHCSYPLRKMFKQTKKLVEKRFPEHHLRVVGGFYFLRFLCPALVCPEGFRLIPAPPAAKSRRSLILVSKILQNLANDVEFGEKESYMVSVNGFIKSNQTTMWNFLDQLSSPTKPRVRQGYVEMKQDPLAAIYQCIHSHREKIGNALSKSGQSQIFDSLCEALDMYNSGSTKAKRAPHPIDTQLTRKRSSSLSVATPTPLSPSSRRVADLIPISSSPSQSFSNLLQLPISPSPSPAPFHSISSSPSHSLPNLLNLGIHAPELSVRLHKLKFSGEKHGEKPLDKTEGNEDTRSGGLSQRGDSKLEKSSDSKPGLSQSGGTEKGEPAAFEGGTAGQPTRSMPELGNREASVPKELSLHELEVELKKEMQEIQALKLTLESGGMGLKERSEMHNRFVGVLHHLKTMLATYKELRRDSKGEEPVCNLPQGDELGGGFDLRLNDQLKL